MSRLAKIIFTLVLVVFVGASVWLSFNAISRPTYEYEEQTDVGGTGVDGVVLSGFNGNPETPIVRVYHPMVKNTEDVYPEAFDYGEDAPVVAMDYLTYTEDEAPPAYIEDTSRTVVAIDKFTFVSDENMQYCYIGPDVTYVDPQAFFGCFALRAIYVDEDNPYYTDIDGVLYTKDMKTMIIYPTYHISHLQDIGKVPVGYYDDPEVHPETYQVPEGVEKIAAGCFYKTWGIREITLPSTLKEIGDMAFFKCQSLQLIELPDGLETIGDDAFSYCFSMMGALYIPDSVKTIGHHCFYKCELNDEVNVEFYMGHQSEAEINLGGRWLPKKENRFTSDPPFWGKTRQEAEARTAEIVKEKTGA